MLDVACGTGIVARTAAAVSDPEAGSSVSISTRRCSPSPAESRPDIDWRHRRRAALPFPDGAFDVVLCQMALMFFPDRSGRSGRWPESSPPAARLPLSAGELDAQPAYGPFVDMAASRGTGGTVAAQHLLRLRRPPRRGGDLRGRGAPRVVVADPDRHRASSSCRGRAGRRRGRVDPADGARRGRDDWPTRFAKRRGRVLPVPCQRPTVELHIPFTCHLVAGVKFGNADRRLGKCSAARAAFFTTHRGKPAPSERAGRAARSAEPRRGRRRSRAARGDRRRDTGERRTLAAEIESTPLMELITKDDYRRIREAAREVLLAHVTANGELHIPFTCHLVAGVKSER